MRQEFRILNGAILVHVHLAQDRFNLLRCEHVQLPEFGDGFLARQIGEVLVRVFPVVLCELIIGHRLQLQYILVQLLVRLTQFRHFNVATVILVHGLEGLTDRMDLTVVQELREHKQQLIVQFMSLLARPQIVEHVRVHGEGLLGGVLTRQPRMLQRLFRRESLLGILHEELANQLHGLLADLVPDGPIKLVIALHNVFLDGNVVSASERQISAEQSVRHDAERPDVARLIVGIFLAEHLGCHEADGAAVSAQVDFLALLRMLRHAKVNEFDAQIVEVAGLCAEHHDVL